MKILAAIVTYNRLALLKSCVDAIQKQTVLPSQILVVNNGSSDGTKEWLDSQNTINIHQNNEGGAGGFYSAIAYAVQEKYDWIWCMDDDGIPHPEALQNLVQFASDKYSALNSVVLSNTNPERLAFGMPEIGNHGYPLLQKSIRTFSDLKKISQDQRTVPYGAFFNGTLISIEAISRVGNVQKELFIWGDEVDMARRLWMYKPICTVLSAFHYHPEPTGKTPLWKLYYGLRNSIYINKKLFNQKFLRILKSILVFFPKFLSEPNGFSLFVRAIRDGFTGKLGKIE
jgi:GT2 family glycosyltransferase